jgi:hypothetical protein
MILGDEEAAMFLRCYSRTKDDKTHTYCALVESVRTDAGPRQHTVAYLGELDHDEQPMLFQRLRERFERRVQADSVVDLLHVRGRDRQLGPALAVLIVAVWHHSVQAVVAAIELDCDHVAAVRRCPDDRNRKESEDLCGNQFAAMVPRILSSDR